MASKNQQKRRGKFQFKVFSSLVKEGQAGRKKSQFARDANLSDNTISNCFKESEAFKIIESNIVRIVLACKNIDINDVMIAAGYQNEEEDKRDIDYYLQKNKIDLKKEDQIKKDKEKYKKFMKSIPSSNHIDFDPLKFSKALSEIFNISHIEQPKKNKLGRYPKYYTAYQNKIKKIENKSTVSEGCFKEYLKGDTFKTITKNNVLKLSMAMPEKYRDEDFYILFREAGYVKDEPIDSIKQDKEKKIIRPFDDLKEEGDNEMWKKDLSEQEECQQINLDTIKEEVKEEVKEEIKGISKDMQAKLDFAESLTNIEKIVIGIKRALIENPIKYDLMIGLTEKQQLSQDTVEKIIYKNLYINDKKHLMFCFNNSESYELTIFNLTNEIDEKITLVLFDPNYFKVIEIKSIN